MAAIEEKHVEEPKPSPQDEEMAIVKAIEKLSLEYNTSLDTLSDAQSVAETTEVALFKLVMKSYKKNGGADPAYDDLFTQFVENKQEVLTKQTTSFKVLQKLRTSQTNYLMSVINSLQAKINEDAKGKEPQPEASPVQEPSSSKEGASTPAPSSRGRLP